MFVSFVWLNFAYLTTNAEQIIPELRCFHESMMTVGFSLDFRDHWWWYWLWIWIIFSSISFPVEAVLIDLLDNLGGLDFLVVLESMNQYIFSFDIRVHLEHTFCELNSRQFWMLIHVHVNYESFLKELADWSYVFSPPIFWKRLEIKVDSMSEIKMCRTASQYQRN